MTTLRGFRIGFAGSNAKHLTEENKPWLHVATAIGGLLATRGHTFMSGGCSHAVAATGSFYGFTGTVAQAFRQSLDDNNPDKVASRIISYVPDPDNHLREVPGQKLLCCGRDLIQRQGFWPSQADVMITLCGGTGTWGEIRGCESHGTPVIPVGCSGGTSLEYWEQILQRGVDRYYNGALSNADFQKLNKRPLLTDLKKVQQFAALVVTCAEKAAAARFLSSPPQARHSRHNRVLICHGRSKLWRDLQAYVQQQLGINCIELGQQPDGSLTVIQKLEAEAAKCSYAIAIMTAEDEMTDGTRRARENVIHEIGFFAGMHGQSRTCILREEKANIPSNLSGVLYIPFRRGNFEAVFAKVEQELRKARLRPRATS